MSKLFSPLKIRDIEFKNRIAVSPMCQYSSENGVPTDWHFVHLGSRAVGGAALVIAEATAIAPEGRISPDDAGIWNDEQVEAYKKITSFIKEQNSVAGIQIAHAGRKASTYSPWKGNGYVQPKDGGWITLAPSAIPFSENYSTPKEMSNGDIEKVVEHFRSAAERSVRAGFEVIEIHMAHGYLVHEFLSPLSNQRKDNYGGSFENRTRLALQIAKAVRQTVPQSLPVFVRISATDWVEGAWDVEQSAELATRFKEIGIDLIDCSSGANVPFAKIPVGPGFQVPLSEKVKKKAGILTGTVGMITTAVQAESILSEGKADLIIMGRELLRNPYWPLQAAKELNTELEWPKQYSRTK